MAHEKFRAEVLTPEGEVFNDEVEMVSTRTGVGSVGILAHHQPLLGLLEPTELRLYKSESDVVTFAQGEGYLQVGRDGVLLLVEDAVEPGDLAVADQRERLQKAEAAVEKADKDSEEYRRAVRDQRRAEAFIKIAEGGSSA